MTLKEGSYFAESHAADSFLKGKVTIPQDFSMSSHPVIPHCRRSWVAKPAAVALAMWPCGHGSAKMTRPETFG